tara:strand:+ start:641 stop:1552 length:912 start_codon:yes stop_codon:yes gene_type:complete
MAFRRPLYYDGSDLREMTDTHIGQIRSRCVNLYGANPSVDITVPSSGGDLGTINDTRKTAGTAISRTSSFAAEFETNEPGTVTVGYSRLDQNVESITQAADTNNRKNFLYQSGGNIYAMTNNDMYDTFYDSAINTLVDGNDRDGTYRIHTGTSLSGHTLISNTAVFSDTRANTGAYTAGGIPEAVDQPFTVTNYYLFRTNQGTLTAQSQLAMLLRSDNDIQTFSQAGSDALLAADMRYWGTQKIRYSVNGSGNNRGSGMANTILNGSGNYQQRFVNADDYRSQEFPNGTAITANTYFLRIRKI